MLTKEQYIKYWIDTAEDDWKRKELHFNASDYVFCLYLTHQTLEKLAKAIWVRTHQDEICTKDYTVIQLEKVKEV